VVLWRPAALPGVRYDSGVETGSDVTVHYDPLLAKVIAHGATREDANRRLVAALGQLGIAGVTTNRTFLLDVLTHPAFAAGELDTHFIERNLPADARAPRRDVEVDRVHAMVAAVAGHEARRRGGGPLPASIPSGWRNNRWRGQDVSFRVGSDLLSVSYVAEPGGRFAIEVDGEPHHVLLLSSSEDALVVEIDTVRRRFALARSGNRWFVHGPAGSAELVEQPRFASRSADDTVGGCLAPMPGIVRQVLVAVGDRVDKGAVMVVLEAMKMEHPLVAHAPGTVKEVRVEVGQMVDPDAVMVVVEPEGGDA
jgi:propionyl-CoA carboxylase alpha chain